MDRELKYALGKTVPIMFSYLFLSMAFGIMMNQAGFPFYWAYLVSLTVYTGAFQFVMVSFLSAATGIAYVLWSNLFKRIQEYGKALSVHDLFSDR